LIGTTDNNKLKKIRQMLIRERLAVSDGTGKCIPVPNQA